MQNNLLDYLIGKYLLRSQKQTKIVIKNTEDIRVNILFKLSSNIYVLIAKLEGFVLYGN